ncbi:MAG: 3' terminal RNA ribose 2'-O-methyltransferase Hen1 [Phormidesmis sp.]
MLLTLTTTHQPATDLGYLLHKHPDRCQSFPMSFGQAHVFYPEANPSRCTAAVLLDVDPVGLVRGKADRSNEQTVEQYVNDRPYVASSFFSVTFSKVFGTALAGRCKDRPELANTPIPLVVNVPVLPCRGGETFLRALFEPLGYEVIARSLPLDKTFPDWPDSVYRDVTLKNTIRLSDLLSHLYVLIPVLDAEKHYWISDDEVEKLLRHGEGWLKEHPAREQITRRYLKRKRQMAQVALARLMEGEDPDAAAEAEAEGWQAIAAKKPTSLNDQRMALVVQVLKEHEAKRVVDLGCGEGTLLRSLLADKSFERLTGVDVSYRELEKAKRRLKLDDLPMHQTERIYLMQGALTYKDERLQGYDAATVIEVIEHMDLDRLTAFERVLFEFAQPPLVIVTTPNSEFNVMYPALTPGKMRHRDHRFEWTRQEFQDWANSVCQRFGYRVTFQNVGFEDLEVGSPTQMGVFVK